MAPTLSNFAALCAAGRSVGKPREQSLLDFAALRHGRSVGRAARFGACSADPVHPVHQPPTSDGSSPDSPGDGFSPFFTSARTLNLLRSLDDAMACVI